MTFLLIAAASFAMFYCIADYAVTHREMKRATSCYRGVAAFDNGVPNTAVLLGSQLPYSSQLSYYHPVPPTALTAEQISVFSALPGVSSTDTRYMTAGIIDGLKRVVRYGSYVAKYDYTDRFVIEGTYTGCSLGAFGGTKINNIKLSDCKQLAGGLPITQGSNVSVVAFANDGGTIVITRGDMHVFYILYDNPFGQNFVNGLAKGDRCLIIGRWDPRYFIDHDLDIMSMFIGDQDTLDYCNSFYLLNDKPENYLDTDEFSKVREIVDITNRDLKTFDMVYTSDMLSIPRFNGRKMVIQEGRALTEADTNSCVVSLAFLELNGLKIGDKLTVDLCDKLLEQHGGMGAAAVIPERYGTPDKKVELKIVGAYVDTDAQYERDGLEWWSYSPNTIFVPLSLLPVEVPDNHKIKPGEFSVVIDDAEQMETFLNKAEPLAKSLGIQLRFSDSGWLKVKDSINTSQTTSLIMTVLYLGAAAVALLLAIYLYIGRGAKGYAIMRALGTPRKKARYTLALPFAVLSALAIPVGGVTGMINASKAISSALANLAEAAEQYVPVAATTGEYVPDASLPIVAMVVCLLGETVLLILLSELFMRKLAKTPPLALLQGNVARIRVKKRTAEAPCGEVAPIPEFVLVFPSGSDMPERGGYGAARHVSLYILRHMHRAIWKTALVVLLAAMLTGTIGLIAVMRLSYQELYDKIEVKGSLSNFSSSAVIEASHSELVKDFYYGGGYSVICNDIVSNTGYLLAFTNDLDRYVQSKSSDKYTVEYGDGYDASLFSGNGAQCVVGSLLAEVLGVGPGDHITLLSYNRMYILSSMYKDKDELDSQIKQASQEFTVAGVITSEDPNIGIGIFAPVSKVAEKISEYNEYPFSVETCKYVLVDKENPYELRDYLDGLAGLDHKYPEAVSYNLDTTELDNIKRVRDMLIQLFPIAVAVAVLIGLIAPVLIIMQSAKEAAILRIFGTTKLRARCMLAFEQIGLCVFGLTLAGLGLLLYNFGLFVRSAGTLMLCGGLYLFGCTLAVTLASMEVTRRRVLELLQVKE